jgi:hypothetical protein
MTRRARKKVRKKEPVSYRFDESVVAVLELLTEITEESMTDIVQRGIVERALGLQPVEGTMLHTAIQSVPIKYRG